MACESGRVKTNLGKAIERKTDQVLLWNAQGIDDTGKARWYVHKQPYHRAYMRALHEEARRRGLEVPEFKPPRLGT